MELRTVVRLLDTPTEPHRLSKSRLPVRSAIVRARRRNRGEVHVGDASVMVSDPGLPPGQALGLRGDPKIDLYDVFVAVEFAGEGVEFTYSRSE